MRKNNVPAIGGTHKKWNMITIFMCSFVCIVLAMVAILGFKADYSYVVQFLLFLLFYVQIPGLGVLNIVKTRYEQMLTHGLIGFFTGMALLLAENWIFTLLGLDLLLKVLNPVLSILYLAYCVTRKEISLAKKIHQAQVKGVTVFYFTAAFAVFMLHMQFLYPNPAVAEYTTVYHDLTWSMGTVNALAQAIPPIDPRGADWIFCYHYFQEMFYSICLKVFSIPADALLFTCSPYLMTYLFGGGLLALFREFCRKKTRAELYGIICMLSSCCIIGSFIAGGDTAASWLNDHIFQNANSVAFSLSGAMTFIISLKYCRKFNFIIVSGLIMGVTTGLKGPAAAVLIGAVLSATPIEIFFRKKANWCSVMTSAVCLIPFLLVYLFVISGIQFERAPKGGTLAFSLTETIQAGALYQSILGSGDIEGVLYYVVVIFIILIQMVLVAGAFSIPYLVYLVLDIKRCFARKAEFNWLASVIFMTILMGVGGFIIVGQKGLSQGYFLFTAFPFMWLAVICMMERMGQFKRGLKGLVVIPFAIGLLWGSVCFVSDAVSTLQEAAYKLAAMRNEQLMTYDSMSKKTYEAMLWIREHTAPDAVFASDRLTTDGSDSSVYNGETRYFYYSAYSQRTMFLEGYSYLGLADDEIKRRLSVLDRIYANQGKKSVTCAVDNNIDYVIVTKLIHPDLDLGESGYELVYENRDIQVFKPE